MNALTEEAVLPTLHNLILTEVYLSGGPVDVFRLWSEMYERQKTIDVGTLLFVRAIAHLEKQGFLQKVSESKSAITGKGEAYLGMAESGLKLASTGNILDVADRGNATSVRIGSLCVGDEGVSGTVEGHGRVGSGLDAKPSAATNSVHAGQPSENQASPADSQILDRHGDDRFADNIQRALEGLPQNGDAEEELAAAEEGAAIEASGYRDPAENVRFA